MASELLAACQLIGAYLNIEISAPPDWPAGGASADPFVTALAPPVMPQAQRDPLAAIVRASRVRVRRVALRGTWWEQDNGPLLAYVEAQPQAPRAPVALLPAARGAQRYRFHDPASSTSQPLTPERAATLEPFAYLFYQRLPELTRPEHRLPEQTRPEHRLPEHRLPEQTRPEQTRPEQTVTLAGLLRFGLQGSRRDLVAAAWTGLALGGLALAPAVAARWLFDVLIPATNGLTTGALVAGLAVAALAGAVLQIARDVALLGLESRWGVTVQAALWDHLLNLPATFLSRYAAGELAARAFSLDALRQRLASVVLAILLNGTLALFSLILLWVYDLRLGLVACGLAGGLLLAVALTGRRLLQYARALQAAQVRMAGLVLQLVSGIARLRVAGAEARAFHVWAARFAEQRRLADRARALSNPLVALSVALPPVALLAVFAVLALRDRATLSIGTALGFLTALSGLLVALQGLSANALALVRVLPLFEDAQPILAARPEVSPGRATPGELTGALHVRNVTFRYRPEAPAVLQEVSLTIRPGEFVALVGPSGSGKSTLLRLLLGFETPTAGAIFYDDRDLVALDLAAVRRQLGVVLQNSMLLPGDIFSNLVGAAPLTREDAWAAVRLAGLEDDIRQMPMGLHTLVGEGGATFSAGQRQRMLIARALIQRPRLVFFDEATSALDNRTQAIVAESLARLKATRLVIAHRLSTIQQADRIYVLEAGRLVQEGTYATLLEQEGLFRELVRRQR